MGQRPSLPQRPFVQGSIAHELIELGRDAVINGERDLLTWCLDNLEPVFNKHTSRVFNWKPGELDLARIEARKLAGNYADLVVKNSLLDGDVRCEHTIGTHQKPLLLDNGLRLTGFIDWLKITGDRAQIYDAKTSSSMRWLDKDQLIFYAIAAEKEFQVEINEVSWMMIRKKDTLSYNITQGDKDRLIQGLLTASQQASTLDIQVFPNSTRCLPCPHSGICNRYANWLLDAGGADMTGEW